mmetsp:Transcript_27779/g.72699  ORF Transcript_27779/g.72699 Transcript_27779/m.72699 type:complete len:303 (-) Transcript_27779:222-1130(-)
MHRGVAPHQPLVLDPQRHPRGLGSLPHPVPAVRLRHLRARGADLAQRSFGGQGHDGRFRRQQGRRRLDGLRGRGGPSQCTPDRTKGGQRERAGDLARVQREAQPSDRQRGGPGGPASLQGRRKDVRHVLGDPDGAAGEIREGLLQGARAGPVRGRGDLRVAWPGAVWPRSTAAPGRHAVGGEELEPLQVGANGASPRREADDGVQHPSPQDCRGGPRERRDAVLLQHAVRARGAALPQVRLGPQGSTRRGRSGGAEGLRREGLLPLGVPPHHRLARRRGVLQLPLQVRAGASVPDPGRWAPD